MPATLRETHRAVVFHEAADIFAALEDDRLRSRHRDETQNNAYRYYQLEGTVQEDIGPVPLVWDQRHYECYC